MATQFCTNDNRAFDDTRVGMRGGFAGQCQVCNGLVCFECMRNRDNFCTICDRFVCTTHAQTVNGRRVCNNHGFWQYASVLFRRTR